MKLFDVLRVRTTSDRVARAIRLVALDRVAYVREAYGGFVALVNGDSGEKHIVYISYDAKKFSCTCMDFVRWRKPCKHILAAAYIVDKMAVAQTKPPSSQLRESRAHHCCRASRVIL